MYEIKDKIKQFLLENNSDFFIALNKNNNEVEIVKADNSYNTFYNQVGLLHTQNKQILYSSRDEVFNDLFNFKDFIKKEIQTHRKYKGFIYQDELKQVLKDLNINNQEIIFLLSNLDLKKHEKKVTYEMYEGGNIDITYNIKEDSNFKDKDHYKSQESPMINFLSEKIKDYPEVKQLFIKQIEDNIDKYMCFFNKIQNNEEQKNNKKSSYKL
jgi:hypothetical protein